LVSVGLPEETISPNRAFMSVMGVTSHPMADEASISEDETAVIVAGSRVLYDRFNSQFTDEQIATFTGRAVSRAVNTADIDHLIHGDNHNSPDRWGHLFAEAAEEIGLDINEIPVPAMWDKLGKAAGPSRNSTMAHIADDAGEAYLVAFYSGNQASTGTPDMIGNALHRGFPVTKVDLENPEVRADLFSEKWFDLATA